MGSCTQNSKNMFKSFFCFVVFMHVIFGARIDNNIIESKNLFEINDRNPLKDTICSLSEDLIREIKSYQPIVDKIVASVVNGEYSGDTWRR